MINITLIERKQIYSMTFEPTVHHISHERFGSKADSCVRKFMIFLKLIIIHLLVKYWLMNVAQSHNM